MKFEIETKELKNIVEKMETVINKKSSFKDFTNINFVVLNNKLMCYAGNGEHFFKINIFNSKCLEDGTLSINIEKIKKLCKLKNVVEICKNENEIKEENNLIRFKVINKNKTITMEGINRSSVKFPEVSIKNGYININESWFYESLVNLNVFTCKNIVSDNIIAMNYLCFNNNNKCIETMDAHKIAVRNYNNNVVLLTKNIEDDYIFIHNMCVSVMKKALNKKSNNYVKMYSDGKYTVVEGNDFQYAIHNFKNINRINIDTIFIPESDINYNFTIEKENLNEVSKFITTCENKDCSKPMVFISHNNDLYSYFNNSGILIVDKLNVENNNVEDKFYMGINPNYISDVCNISSEIKLKCSIKDSKCPLILEDNEYKFLVLPINCGKSNVYSNFISTLKEE